MSQSDVPPICIFLNGSALDFYTKNELPLRLALFWMSSNVCSIAASFIAFGVLRMRGVLGRAGWRYGVLNTLQGGRLIPILAVDGYSSSSWWISVHMRDSD